MLHAVLLTKLISVQTFSFIKEVLKEAQFSGGHQNY